MKLKCVSVLLALTALVWRGLAGPWEVVQLGQREVAADRILVRFKSPSTAEQRSTLLAEHQLEVLKEYQAVPGLLLVRFSTVPRVQSTVPRPPDRLAAAGELARRITDLAATGWFEYVEPDYVIKSAAVPNDAAYHDGRLWGLNNLGGAGTVAGADIDAARAWELAAGDPNVVVVVIDSGVRTTHQELAPQMWVNPDEIPGNGIDDDGDGYVDNVHGIDALSGGGDPQDNTGHGTWVAGTIAAAANDGHPMVGVAWQARLMALKFLGPSGGSTGDALECIEFAIAEKQRMGSATRMILNCSWDQGGGSLRDAIQAAGAAGILYVASAGNHTLDLDTIPAFHGANFLENMVSVAAVRADDLLAWFSNWGASLVHLGAPGEGIQTTGYLDDADYASYGGTSAAAPHAAGVAALIWSRFPEASPAEVRQRLILGAVPIPSLAGSTLSGGRLNAYNALTVAPDDQLELELGFVSDRLVEPGENVILRARVTDLHLILDATVTGELSTGGSFAFADDGSWPDEVAGDGIHTGTFSAPLGVTDFALEILASGPTPKLAVAKTVQFTVEDRPSNDRFAFSENIQRLPAIRVASNARALAEAGEPDLGWVASGRSLWWSWTATESGVVIASTTGSDFDTLLGVCVGDEVGTLSVVASGLRLDTGSQAMFAATAGVRYHFLVDGFFHDRGNVQLNLDHVAPAGNDNFSNRHRLSGSAITVRASDFGAGGEPGEPHHNGLPPVRSIWWEWNSGLFGGTVVISTVGSTPDTHLAVYEGETLEQLVLRAGNDDAAIDRHYSEVRFVAQPARRYQIVVDRKSSAPGLIELNLAGGAENDDFHSAPELTGALVQVSGNNLTATGQLGEPGYFPSLANMKSIWWRWHASAPGEVIMTTHGSGFDTTLEVFSGPSLQELTVLASNDDRNLRQADSLVRFAAIEGTTYHIRVNGKYREEVVTGWERIPPWVDSGRVQLLICQDETSRLKLAAPPAGDGPALVELVGAPGGDYRVLGSTSLTDWSPTWTGLILNSHVLIEDMDEPPAAARFFRAVRVLPGTQ